MKKIFKAISLALCISMVGALTACGATGSKSETSAANTTAPAQSQAAAAKTDSSEKINIVASFYPMADFTSKIGGDKVTVTNLVKPGVEPHDWEPTPQDMKTISEAKIVVYNGLGMEGWIDQVKSSLNGKVTFVEASQGIDPIKVADEEVFGEEEESENKDGEKHEEEHEHGLYDPHVWMSPELARVELKNIKEALVKASPENKDYFEKNYKEFDAKLATLSDAYKTGLEPLKGKTVVAAHMAFGYLCRSYGLKQIGIAGLDADSEPSPAKLAEIIKFCKENKVKTIFFEELVSPKLSETIAKEAGAKTQELNPLEGLSDEEIAAGQDYLSVMQENLTNLINGIK